MRHIFVFALAIATSTAAYAEIITFEEFTATNGSGIGLRNQYQYLGVEFTLGFAHTYDDVSAGDPGGFGISADGNHQFLGVRATEPTIRIQFDAPVQQFSLRAVQGGIPFTGDSLDIVAWDGQQIVDTVFTSFGFGQGWTTIEIDGSFDVLTLSAGGFTGNAMFGIDNLQWARVPSPGVLSLVGIAGGLAARRRRA